MCRAIGSWYAQSQGLRKVLFEINLDGDGTTYARDLSSISYFPDEKEIVLTCYSGFKVLERKAELKWIVIKLKTKDTLRIEEEANTPTKVEANTSTEEEANTPTKEEANTPTNATCSWMGCC